MTITLTALSALAVEFRREAPLASRRNLVVLAATLGGKPVARRAYTPEEFERWHLMLRATIIGVPLQYEGEQDIDGNVQATISLMIHPAWAPREPWEASAVPVDSALVPFSLGRARTVRCPVEFTEQQAMVHFLLILSGEA